MIFGCLIFELVDRPGYQEFLKESTESVEIIFAKKVYSNPLPLV